jgi:Na+:H+ antiporter, NhaA family
VVPIFALANAGVAVSGATLKEAVTSPIGLGVILGLVVGKPLGITGAVWLGSRTGIGRLPAEVTPRMILGVASLAGIGFTMALFIAELAFDAPDDIETAKLGILVASLGASLLGVVILRSAHDGDTVQRRMKDG